MSKATMTRGPRCRLACDSGLRVSRRYELVEFSTREEAKYSGLCALSTAAGLPAALVPQDAVAFRSIALSMGAQQRNGTATS